MAIKEIEALTEEQQRALAKYIKHCVDCGVAIVGSPASKRCKTCNEVHARDVRKNYFKLNFTGVRYEHDPYISGKKGM